ncbi:hypothetical protein HYPDE_40628 [Hyphomicrobium denitrificans 1NES1]|uniref:Uncharacterized protein n=1 Tax=Hyphomicrobium denitrificans 1NES1 TaxID=670307 RepID=N0B837_9HYPH|nr:hypothetical protein HYPDE_40628 [Hyphomicrobium denitrificans 1NES1]
MAADAGASDGVAKRAAAELEGFVMKGTSGEQEGPSRRALSLDPTGSNPFRPTSRSRHAAAFTAHHHAMRVSRVAFASRSSRSP